jgi:hypothetical protein
MKVLWINLCQLNQSQWSQGKARQLQRKKGFKRYKSQYSSTSKKVTFHVMEVQWSTDISLVAAANHRLIQKVSEVNKLRAFQEIGSRILKVMGDWVMQHRECQGKHCNQRMRIIAQDVSLIHQGGRRARQILIWWIKGWITSSN